MVHRRDDKNDRDGWGGDGVSFRAGGPPSAKDAKRQAREAERRRKRLERELKKRQRELDRQAKRDARAAQDPKGVHRGGPSKDKLGFFKRGKRGK